MKKEAKKTGAMMAVVLAVAVMLMVPVTVLAGDLEPSAAPGSTMHTLDEIYEVCAGNCPGSTTGAPVAQTGQTTCYDASGTVIACAGTGQDGEHQAGVASPAPRFTDNGDGTVTDNLTGLIWLKNANCFGTRDWATALSDCNTLNSGECGLSDGSVEGDWRLPNRNELNSLVDAGNYGPALPTGHPFSNVQSSYYWSGTSYAGYTDHAWLVSVSYGHVNNNNKSYYLYVWPVRSDN